MKCTQRLRAGVSLPVVLAVSCRSKDVGEAHRVCKQHIQEGQQVVSYERASASSLSDAREMAASSASEHSAQKPTASTKSSK